MSVLSNKGYSVLVTDLTPSQLSKVKRELTVTPTTHPDYPDARPFPAFETGHKWIRMPRHFALQRYGPPMLDSLIDKTISQPERLTFNGTLREAQETPHDQVLHHLRSDRSGLLCLHTGGGKTIIMLSILSKLKQRTCILMHKSNLLQQWKEKISLFLPDAKVGIVQGKDKEFTEDNDIYLVMIQTLLNIPVVPPIFGFTTIDECHHLPSETFSRVLFKVNARFLLGLSATPQRKDGLTHLLQWHLGPIIYQEKPNRSDQSTTEVEIHRYDVSHLDLDIKKFSQSITTLCNDVARNDYVLSVILDVLKRDLHCRRRILVLSDRRSQCVYLVTGLRRIQASADDASCHLQDRSFGLLYAGMAADSFKIEGARDVIFGTYGLMQEGIDIPDLNAVIFASPRREVIQAVGRIYRKVHKDIQPLIVDISDSAFRSQERVRLGNYKNESNQNIAVKYINKER